MGTIDANRCNLLNEISKKISYEFNNIGLLNEALTHSSYANENKKRNIQHNERLEFLGDSVLGIVISDYLYKNLSASQEGELTKIRASIVCEPSLANSSIELCMGKYLMLGKGEEVTGGRERISILADTFEAVIGAIYLDGGLENAKMFILSNLKNTIKDAIEGRIFQDYKTHLQEIIQSKGNDKIEYEVIDEKGPDHNKIFYVQVKIGGEVIGKGSGKSKKEAEQKAAKEALKKVV